MSECYTFLCRTLIVKYIQIFSLELSRCRFPKFEKGMILKGLRQDSSELACYSHNGGVVHFKPTNVPFCPTLIITMCLKILNANITRKIVNSKN